MVDQLLFTATRLGPGKSQSFGKGKSFKIKLKVGDKKQCHN
jgi:hypothetical protein